MSARHGPQALRWALLFLISLVVGKTVWDLAVSNPEYAVAALGLALLVDGVGLEMVRPLIWYALSYGCLLISFALAYVNAKEEEKINVVFEALMYLPVLLVVMVMFYIAKRLPYPGYALQFND